ncbi:MAG: class I SAM-dependent rRNA methyltransferase [Bacteroidales bacterium]
MSPCPTITLKPGKEQSMLRFHPWVFSGAIKKMSEKPAEGQLVDVVSNEGLFLGKGHYQPSSISVRILSFQQEEIDLSFWKRRISNAWQVRKACGLTDSPATNVFRLIHGEGDDLPGLIADFYNGLLVTQMHSAGMYLERGLLAQAFREILGDRLLAIYDKSEGALPYHAPVKAVNGFIFGSGGEFIAKEYDKLFSIDYSLGQKTGFFIDQRENRRLLQEMARDREVLNMFCYTGGFSVYALAGGAKLVHSVDSSKQAIDLTRKNVLLNFGEENRHEAFATDAFDFLRQADQKYDLIILDPPAFAKHTDALKNALQGYKKLNARAIEAVRPGGIIFTFSCSQVVNRDAFRKAVFSGAAVAGRSVRILHQLSQPEDHPVNIYHPEGEYLKGLVLYVE